MVKEQYQLGLIGYPLEHSFSPAMHKSALAALGIPGDYQLTPIRDDKNKHRNIRQICNKIRIGDLDGLNVTIPYKTTVFDYIDLLSKRAEIIGAVNTIYKKGGQLIGDNTDAPGFYRDLQDFLVDQTQLPSNKLRSALILGAGGAARAIVYSLAIEGWNITVAARRIEQAKELVNDLINSIPYRYIAEILLSKNQIQDFLVNFNTNQKSNDSRLLIINTTPAGMYPNIGSTTWPDSVDLPNGSVVYDLVYNPDCTTLMKMAEKKGLPASNGLGMLLEQAVLSFELWTGIKPPKEVMRNTLLQEAANDNLLE